MITNKPTVLDVSAIRGTGENVSVTVHIESPEGLRHHIGTTKRGDAFLPMMVTVDWRWTGAQFVADAVLVAGDAYRGDGTVGTWRRSADYKMFGAGDALASNDFPAWLTDLVESMRPASPEIDLGHAASALSGNELPGRVDVLKAETHTEATVRVDLTGAPQVKASYSDRHIVPAKLTVHYTYDPAAGWWRATSAKVTGPRVLKPKADGTLRLGQEWHDREWSVFGKGDVQVDKGLPEWLDSLVSELRPAGEVSVPGM
ncbi:hypothetical protein SEA_MISCHIEF19_70 [Streptomyces phage Mischief19]|nr:hypothetical protein SEA_MISCHIEF19_70 [Streptomyces phage Mischief19]